MPGEIHYLEMGTSDVPTSKVRTVTSLQPGGQGTQHMALLMLQHPDNESGQPWGDLAGRGRGEWSCLGRLE